MKVQNLVAKNMFSAGCKPTTYKDRKKAEKKSRRCKHKKDLRREIF
jgi:hypothetical protein